MKHERQQAILNLIRSRDIYTQGEITEALEDVGFTIAQATVSRDIRELRLIREATEHGLKYAVPPESNNPLKRAFLEGLVDVNHGANMLVIHTHIGMAMAVATALDSMNYPEIIGTIAGDDTIMCVIKTEELAANLAAKLKEII